MDKYEYKLRLEEIKTLNRKGRFQEAAQVADTVDWKKVRNISTLGIISDVYKVNRRFEDAKVILLLAKEQSPQNRRILYSLCDLTIKMGQVVEAVEYYKEYVQMAPNDSSKYILLYKIYEAQDISLDERIAVLKEYKKREYNEKWAYELASLYHRCGYATECVEECDQLILWFGEGRYVAKAMELKRRYVPLSPAQQQAYDRMFGRRPGQEEEQPVVKEEQQAVSEPAAEEVPQEEEMDIQVKTMDMGQYNTMNLQAALAESMKEVMEPEAGQSGVQYADYGRQNIAADGEAYAYEPQEEPAAQGGWSSAQQAEGYAVQPEGGIQQTGGYAAQPEDGIQQNSGYAAQPEGSMRKNGGYAAQPEDGMRQVRSEVQEQFPLQQAAYGGDNADYQEDIKKVMRDSAAWDVQATGQLEIEEQPAAAWQEKAAEQQNRPTLQKPGRVVAYAQPVTEEAGMQQAEERPVERQITGQMNIEDVLAEWEKLKKKNEEKRRQETRQWMLQQTGSLFDDFDQLSRDGVLEKLQREESLPIEPVQSRRRAETAGFAEAEELNPVEEVKPMTQEVPIQAQARPRPANATARAVMAAQGVMDEIPAATTQNTGVERQAVGQSIQPVQAAEPASENMAETGAPLPAAATGQNNPLSEAEQKQLAIEALMREAEEKQRQAQALLQQLEAERQAMLAQHAALQQGVQPQQQSEQLQQQYAQQQSAQLQQQYAQPVMQSAQLLQQPAQTMQQTTAGVQPVQQPAQTMPQQATAGVQPVQQPVQTMPQQTTAGVQSVQQPVQTMQQTTAGVQPVQQPAQTAAVMQAGAQETLEYQNGNQPVAEPQSGNQPQEPEKNTQNQQVPAESRQEAAGTPENAAEDAVVSGNTAALHERIREQQYEEHERNMTQDEKDLFAPFVPTRGAMRQLVKALDSISLSAFTGNMIVTGAPGSDMMKLAKSVIKIMRVRDQNFSGKLAKISGDVLNTRDAVSIVAKIPNGALIIEKGGKLSDEGAANLVKALNQEQTGIIVFLLDTKRSITRLMERSPQLAACFTARFDIAALDTGTLVKYGCQYAYNMEYSIDELGRLALHTRIEDMQTRDHAVTVEEVRDIIDEAIDHATRFSIRHFLDVLFRRRYDDDDMIILRERDFI